MLKYDIEKRKADLKKWIWERKKMFTVIRSNYLCLESLECAALNHKEEWSFRFVYPNKNKHGRNTVMKGVSLLWAIG